MSAWLLRWRRCLPASRAIAVTSARNAGGFAMTVDYWRGEVSVKNRENVAGRPAAQVLGAKRWHAHDELRIAKVECTGSGPEGRADAPAQAATWD